MAIGIGFVGGWAPATGATKSPSVSLPMRTCKNCPEFVALKPFKVGNRTITHAAKYELTWKNYLEAHFNGTCALPKLSVRKGHSPSNAEMRSLALDWPIGVLSLEQIKCYSGWLHRQTGMSVDIPTAAEWEFIHQLSEGAPVVPSADHELSAPHTERPPYSIVFDNVRWRHIRSTSPSAVGIFGLHSMPLELTSTCKNDGRLGNLVVPRCVVKGALNPQSAGPFTLIVEGQPSIDTAIRLVAVGPD